MRTIYGSEKFALLESAEEVQFVQDQAAAVTFFDVNGRTMLNVEGFFYPRTGLLCFWQRSCSSKYCHLGSLGSMHVDMEQILFHWPCVVLDLLTSDNILVDRPEGETYCNTHTRASIASLPST